MNILAQDLDPQVASYLKVINQAAAVAGQVLVLDSGSLLGMTRDGCFLPNDNDVDFAALAWSDESVAAFERELKKRGGAALRQTRFRGRTSQLDAFVSHGLPHISIHFYETSRAGYCLAHSTVAAKRPWTSRRKHTGTKFAGVSRRRYSAFWQRIRGSIPERLFVMLGFRYEILWVVPQSFLVETSPDRRLRRIVAPMNAEQYLHYVYGVDWRTPNPEWCTADDDGRVYKI